VLVWVYRERQRAVPWGIAAMAVCAFLVATVLLLSAAKRWTPAGILPVRILSIFMVLYRFA